VLINNELVASTEDSSGMNDSWSLLFMSLIPSRFGLTLPTAYTVWWYFGGLINYWGLKHLRIFPNATSESSNHA
jgi:hypothetical protein